MIVQDLTPTLRNGQLAVDGPVDRPRACVQAEWKPRYLPTTFTAQECHMSKIEDGKILDKKVEIKTYSSIEHGNMSGVTSIVLHRTDSYNAAGTLSAYAKGKESGAHFLIDKNGQIYQTANLKKFCQHVGVLLPRCEIEKTAILRS